MLVMYFGSAREEQAHPSGPVCTLSPSALDVIFVLWQPIKARSSNVPISKARVIGR